MRSRFLSFILPVATALLATLPPTQAIPQEMMEFALIKDPLLAGHISYLTKEDAWRFKAARKDPLLAGYLSSRVPGLGQAYAGRPVRGAFFFLGTAGAFKWTSALAHPENASRADGNAGRLAGEKDREKRPSHKQSFHRLSTGRKAGVVASAVAGVGLYIWNVIDAERTAEKYNRKALEQKGYSRSRDRDRTRPLYKWDEKGIPLRQVNF